SLLIGAALSQEILGGIGDRESYGGGPYANDAQLETLAAALTAPDAQSTWTGLQQIGRDAGATGPLLIPITGRTGTWLAHGIRYWPGYYAPLARYRNDPGSQIPGVIARPSDPTYFQPFWL